LDQYCCRYIVGVLFHITLLATTTIPNTILAKPYSLPIDHNQYIFRGVLACTTQKEAVTVVIGLDICTFSFQFIF
jgi:hypothetical protein